MRNNHKSGNTEWQVNSAHKGAYLRPLLLNDVYTCTGSKKWLVEMDGDDRTMDWRLCIASPKPKPLQPQGGGN